MLLVSKFEILPDEILMIIIRYSGDIVTIFRTFSGLNQPINNILIDRRTHLLTDFLCTGINDVNIDYYYKSGLFQNMLTGNDTQCLQSLVSFYIQDKYKQSVNYLESGTKQFQSKRMQLTDNVIVNLDKKLKKAFKELQHCSKPMKNIMQIEFLIITEGARLECSDDEYFGFNFTDAVNHLLLSNITNVRSVSSRFLNSLVRMFKLLLITNLKLLHNRAYVVNGGCVIYYFLFHAIYHCREFNCQRLSPSFNIQYYRAAVDLLLFVLQCLKYELVDENWWISSFLDILKSICSIQLTIDQEIFVYTSQIEILKILFDENILYKKMSFDVDSIDRGIKSIGNLIMCDRLDIILFLFHYDEYLRNFLQNCWNYSKFIDILTGNQRRRQLFHAVLNDRLTGLCLTTNTDLLFILLQKKECKLVKKLFHLSPLLVHRLDKDGNDSLLYVCLNVRGCRHRLIEYLIKMKCDLQRRNFNNENFIDVLQLGRNRKLLRKLIEHEIIQYDYESGEIKVNVVEKKPS